MGIHCESPELSVEDCVKRRGLKWPEQQFESKADVRRCLPGTWTDQVVVTVPAELPAGTYPIDLAILDRPGANPNTEPLPPLQLAIEGRREDGSYPLSRLEVK
jgi:hypothetical protein